MTDEKAQETWCSRVAESIVSRAWGTNMSTIDQITEMHKKGMFDKQLEVTTNCCSLDLLISKVELAVLRDSHDAMWDMHEKRQSIRLKNLRKQMVVEETKVRLQVSE
jgi:hypothetical protein